MTAMGWALVAVFCLASWLYGYGCGARSVRRQHEKSLIDSAIATAERDTRRVALWDE